MRNCTIDLSDLLPEPKKKRRTLEELRLAREEKVTAKFESEGYVLRSQYVNNTSKLEFTCPEGHEHSISWHSFNSGSRCGICCGRHVTHEQVQAAFESEGYLLRSQ